MPICCRQYRGFTLLEVLIAMSIFAIIGLASYRVLNVVILSQSQLSVHDEKIRTLERAMHIISADFEQLANRPVRDNYADTLAALIAPHDNYAIEFTRQGWRNPLQLPRSQLQRVAYELGSIANDSDEAGTHLLRHYWTVLDRAQDSEPRTQVLLKDIDDLQIRFMDQQGQWQNEWPAKLAAGESSKGLPVALLVELHSPKIGNIQRMFQLTEISDWQNSGFGKNITTLEEQKSADDEETETEPTDNDIEEYDAEDDDYDPNDFYDLGGD